MAFAGADGAALATELALMELGIPAAPGPLVSLDEAITNRMSFASFTESSTGRSQTPENLLHDALMYMLDIHRRVARLFAESGDFEMAERHLRAFARPVASSTGCSSGGS